MLLMVIVGSSEREAAERSLLCQLYLWRYHHHQQQQQQEHPQQQQALERRKMMVTLLLFSMTLAPTANLVAQTSTTTTTTLASDSVVSGERVVHHTQQLEWPLLEEHAIEYPEFLSIEPNFLDPAHEYDFFKHSPPDEWFV